ncbi:glycoside hydrolase family 3 protein [Natribacillus halophilus]|uniref:beta-N-acetylhexosaminidase n=1 Tax=Natribacillus halophilus TaxID=549003 RepID=A0A1G8KZ31_9BACI|nr:glycoside hydrolase family 3 protein [Natribacillus halophilus]SDI48607.1 beta-N-acetylhexosaminidase [Natribacillus halophilus]
MRLFVKNSVLLVLMACLAFAGGSLSFSQAENQNDGKDLILYENIEQVDVLSPEEISFQAMNVYEDGDFTFVNDGIAWHSNNEDVATVDEHGDIEWTGQPGRTYIEASNGSDQDQIVLHYKPDEEGGPDIVKQTDERHALVEDAINGMTIEEKVGQMLMPEFRTWHNEKVTKMLPAIEQLVERYHLGGVVLFGENVQTPAQTVELISDYQAASDKYGMLITSDQEGGLVTRLSFGTGMPGNMALGAGNNPAMSKRVGRTIGAELEALGINMNLAPSFDVNNNPDNPVIGVRSFGEDPVAVARHGVAVMEGTQEAGVAVTAKHFPGHGDTDVDSHIGSPEVPHDRDRLSDVEWHPFQEAINHDVDAIMTAHVALPAIENSGKEITLPATLSEKVLTGLMREEMGYEGVIYTDSLQMNAIASHFTPVEAAIRAIQAGSDIVLMPVDVEEVAEWLITAVQEGEISEERIDDSVERILTLKLKRGIVKEEHPFPVEEKIEQAEATVRSDEHLQVEKQAAEQGVTVVKNEDNALPIDPLEGETVVVLGTKYAGKLANALASHHPEVEAIALPENGKLSTAHRQKVQQADVVIAETHTSDADMRQADHPQMEMVRQLQNEISSPLISIGIRNPYDLMAYPEADVYVAQYGSFDANFAATANVLFGKVNPVGRLPVTIPSAEGGVLYETGHGLSYQDDEEFPF